MKFVVLFEDNPRTGQFVRAKHMPQHLAFLDENADRVDAAGPLRAQDGSGAGGLSIVTADTADEVQQLVESDPFWGPGLRKSVNILEWAQVFAGGMRIV